GDPLALAEGGGVAARGADALAPQRLATVFGCGPIDASLRDDHAVDLGCRRFRDEPAPQIGKHRCRVALERIAKAAAALPAYREHIAALHPDQAGLWSERGPVDAVTQGAVLGCLFAPALNHGGAGIAAEQAGRVRHLGAVSHDESIGGLDAAERERNL